MQASLLEEQTVLFVNESIYTPRLQSAERNRTGLLPLAGRRNSASDSVEGTVTFDIPEKIAMKIAKEGSLDFLSFGAEYYEPEEFYEQKEVGTIRIYK